MGFDKSIARILGYVSPFGEKSTFNDDTKKLIITNAYFAKQVAEVKKSGIEEYIFKGNNDTSTESKKNKIAGIISSNINKAKESDEVFTKVADIVKLLTKSKYSKGNVINIPLYKEIRGKYQQISSGKLEDVVYIIIEGKNVKNKKVFANILDKDNTIATISAANGKKLVPVLIGDKQKVKIESTFKFFDSKSKSDFAAIKIKLRPKKDDDLIKMYNKLDSANDDKASLYLLIDIHTSNSDVKKENIVYQGRNRGTDSSKNYWLDLAGNYFQLGFSDCGRKFIKKFRCTRYNGKYGPVYDGSIDLASFKNWDKLISDKKITEEEKEILIGMSENEGNLDTVQSYDSEIMSPGAMQKTVSPEGKGEFPVQVEEFKEDNPEKYKSLFENCGWIVEDKTMYYKDPHNPNSEKITGKELKTEIRNGFTKDNFGKKNLRCKLLEPIVKAISDEDFQAKQVTDFIKRLKEVLNLKPNGYDYRLKDYLNSKLGKATVLDHHINRPGYVRKDFAEALTNFFTNKDKEVDEANKTITDESKKKKKVPRNPADWGTNHSKYEKSILDDYGKNRRGTDMEKRYKKMKDKL